MRSGYAIDTYRIKLRPIFDEMGGSDALAVVWPNWVYLLDFFCYGIQLCLLLSPYICFISFLYLNSFVLGDDALIS